MLLSSLLPLFVCGFIVGAYAQNHPTRGASIPLKTRHWNDLTDEERRNWFLWQKHNILRKYKATTGKHKRASTGSLQLTDYNIDFTYSGNINIGTPSKSFGVILDTGSSDLWLASAQCDSGCEDVQDPYDSTKSSSFKDTGNSIHIAYGSGDVSGEIGTETVSFGGFSVTKQAFGVMTQLSTGIINPGVNLTGLMGLAFTPLAETAVDPAWLTMAKNNQWTQPLFAFYLARYSNDVNAQTTETNGGTMDLGFVDNTKYTGNLNYISLSSQTYWAIPLSGATVNGQKTGISGDAAIDTGTSLIGGPSDQVANFYSLIKGAAPGTGDNEGYYVYPCTTTVNVTLTFGGTAYSIQPDDFSRAADNTGQTCLGAIFQTDTGTGSPVNWIVGDAFLKNVYTVFRQSPAGVGFAVAKTNNGGTSSTGRPTQTAPVPTNNPGSTGANPTSTESGLSFSLPFPLPTHFGSGSKSAYSIDRGLVSVVGTLMGIMTGVMIML